MISARAVVENGNGRSSAVALFFSDIDTGNGSDELVFYAEAEGSGIRATAISSADISTGSGNDNLVAEARALGTGSGLDSAYGIINARIDLGGGNDSFTAKATGTLLNQPPTAVSDTIIIGGSGNDDFEIAGEFFGEKTINGGADTDRLTLEGNRDDFSITETGGATAEIRISGEPGKLFAIEIEQFEFDDGVFLFDELFVV